MDVLNRNVQIIADDLADSVKNLRRFRMRSPCQRCDIVELQNHTHEIANGHTSNGEECCERACQEYRPEHVNWQGRQCYKETEDWPVLKRNNENCCQRTKKHHDWQSDQKQHYLRRSTKLGEIEVRLLAQSSPECLYPGIADEFCQLCLRTNVRPRVPKCHQSLSQFAECTRRSAKRLPVDVEMRRDQAAHVVDCFHLFVPTRRHIDRKLVLDFHGDFDNFQTHRRYSHGSAETMTFSQVHSGSIAATLSGRSREVFLS